MSDKPHANKPALLAGVRVIESALLGPGATGMHLADLGADVIKVEAPGGDYVRKMAWPIIDGVSLLHWHINRGKRSLVLDLRKPEAVDLYLELVRGADVVIEAMRPGALARRGISYERMREANPQIVFCMVSGYGLTGPYCEMPSHGIAYDAWAGVVRPAIDENGLPAIPSYTTIGIHAGPLFAAMAILAGVIRARATGEGCRLDIAQSDAAAAFSWNGIEGHKAYERPESEVTGNDGDGKGARRPVGEDTMRDSVRYQIYASKDGYVLFMASEREFWKNFAEGIGRPELFEREPGARFADHARGNTALRRELVEIFKTRTTVEWIEFGKRVNTPIAPVNTTKTIADDPQFKERFPWLPHGRHGTDLMPTPVRVLDEELPVPRKAPTPGQDSDAVLADVLGYDSARIAALRATGALG
jgi:crotonobetainyl-CoA:carnitine CoA-transferase CaiB-like acyl-CoA transferase